MKEEIDKQFEVLDTQDEVQIVSETLAGISETNKKLRNYLHQLERRKEDSFEEFINLEVTDGKRMMP